jgi:hypothetical protein
VINLGQVNFDDSSVIGQPLVLKKTSSLNAIGTVATGAGLIFNVVTVETLPAATNALKGTVLAVSDAPTTPPALGATLTGGGTTFCLALCTGTVWVAV